MIPPCELVFHIKKETVDKSFEILFLGIDFIISDDLISKLKICKQR